MCPLCNLNPSAGGMHLYCSPCIAIRSKQAEHAYTSAAHGRYAEAARLYQSLADSAVPSDMGGDYFTRQAERALVGHI
jgi:hypothetical protein